MAKIETAAQFKALMESGKYENKINAQRAAGRTRLKDTEKQKAFAAIEAHFGADPAPAAAAAKPAKKAGKKAAKKAGKKKVAAAAPATTATPVVPAPATSPPTTKKVAKKVAKKKAGKKKVSGRKAVAAPPEETGAPPGTLAISPSEVTSVAGMLQVIDSTVKQGVSIAMALQQTHEINQSGDISEGIQFVKTTLTRAAQLLQESVVDPLRKAGAHADPEVASRLQAVVASAGEPFQPNSLSPNDVATQMAANQQQPPHPQA